MDENEKKTVSPLANKRPTAARRVQMGPKTVIREISADEIEPLKVEEQVINPAAPLQKSRLAEKTTAARAKADAEARALADAEARAKAEAKARARAKAEAEARAKAKAEAEARAKAKAEAEARAKAEAEARAKAEAEARAKAEAEARAKAEAEARARAKAEAEARAKAEAEARAKAVVKARAKAEAEARAKAAAAATAAARAKAQTERTEQTVSRQKPTADTVQKNAAPASKNNKMKKKKKKTWVRALLRTLLVIFTLIVMLAAGLCMVMNEAFNGPSESARTVLTMSMLESSGMKWVPAIFIGKDTVEEIRAKNENAAVLPEDQSDPTQIVIERDTVSGDKSDYWKDYPDGIRIEEISGDTYNAHLMMIRDPAAVYLATSTKNGFKRSIPGTRINNQIVTEGAIAAINGGAFYDNGTSSPEVGSTPCGLVISQGKVVWNDGDDYNYGFVGFNENDVLVVAKTMTANQAKELSIRDGCAFGPVLIMNGAVNEEAYNTNSGYNPRTAVGQRADGTVLFLCIDGRQAGSLGGTYADAIDILVEYGAVNACNLDGGSSSVMLYKDTTGRYGTKNNVVMINNYSLLQEEPRKMPTFFMVRPGK